MIPSAEQKYEAEVTATDDGLQISTEEDDLEISRPGDPTDQQFILLTVTDDGKM